jgi:hypothetical protein
MSVGKWIKKGAVSFVMATGGVGKNALSQGGENTDAGQLSAIPMGQNTLMRDLKEGNVTQQVKEFRKHHYQVLQAAEKFKTKWGKDGDFKMLTEEEIVSNRVAQGDPYDNYKVEVSIDNVAISKSLLEYEEKDMVRPIKVRRNVNSQCRIEESSTKLHVRDIDGTRKLLDFYIDDTPENRRAVLEARGLMTSPGISDFNNITNVSFTTPGGNMMVFEYKVLAFDKVVEYNGSYIVKMFAECTKNGEWAAEKYMIID